MRGRARPWRARRASMAVETEGGGAGLGRRRAGRTGGAWEKQGRGSPGGEGEGDVRKRKEDGLVELLLERSSQSSLFPPLRRLSTGTMLFLYNTRQSQRMPLNLHSTTYDSL